MKNLMLAATMLLSTACYTVVHDYRGTREVTPGTQLSQPSTKLGNVNDSKKACFLFWGLLDLNSASGPELVEEQAIANHGQDFDGLTHVRIHEEQGAVDVIVEILTLGIFSMLTVESEAQVHRFEGGGA